MTISTCGAGLEDERWKCIRLRNFHRKARHGNGHDLGAGFACQKRNPIRLSRMGGIDYSVGAVAHPYFPNGSQLFFLSLHLELRYDPHPVCH